MTKNCTLCCFAIKPQGTLNPPLQCWRFPPQMVAIPVQTPAVGPGGIINGKPKPGIQLMPMRPIVGPQVYCHEFAPIEVANDKEATA